jgi:phospholipid/cholesterol/gamma-HCH transport system ATP-binding protein
MNASSTAVLYHLRDVWKSFDNQPVLRGVDLVLRRGETVGIIGPSGAGKSVLVKCMVALLSIDRGELRFDGRSVPDMSDDERTHLRKRVSLLFQQGGLFDSMTVEENLEYGLHEQFSETMTSAQMRERAAWALQAVGLSQGESVALPASLSGGMQRRVGIARAITTRPEVVLYDEPTQGLDPPNAHRISDLIADLRDEFGFTSVIVSHDLRTVVTLCDRVGYLHEGRFLEMCRPEALHHSEHVQVCDFVMGHPPEEPFNPRESQAPEPWPKT